MHEFFDLLQFLCTRFLDKNKTKIKWPNVYRSKFDDPSPVIRTKPLRVLMQRRPHVWGSPYVADLDQAVRPLGAANTRATFPTSTRPAAMMTDKDIEEFGKHPLAGFLDQVQLRTRAQQGMNDVSPELPISLDRHPCAVSHIAETTLRRFTDDCELFAEQINKSKSWRLTALYDDQIAKLGKDRAVATKAAKQVRSVIAMLQERKAADMEFVRDTIPTLVECANLVPDDNGIDAMKFLFARHSGAATEVWFELLVQYLMSAKGKHQLLYCNPFLSDQQVECIMKVTAAVLFRVNRVQQIIRCLQSASGLLKLLQSVEADPKCFSDGMEKEVWLAAKTLASGLAAERFYVKSAGGGVPETTYRPRMLVFEFIFGYLMRKSQVVLIDKFLAAVERGDSVCHQMIMGAGKTTVISPMLQLILADGERFVMQVVPSALLQFAKDVARAAFSAVIHKTVYTLQFDRFSDVSAALFYKFQSAAETRSIVVSNPTSVKSLALKFVELCHRLDLSDMMAADQGFQNMPKDFNAFLSKLGFFKGRDNEDDEDLLSTVTVSSLRAQIEICKRVFNIFRAGVMLLDEVDMILHPLKSELNWPIGPKDPLDFTTNCSVFGMRWLVPFHLLDAIFYANGMPLASNFSESREALLILEKIKAVIQSAAKDKRVQATPHFVLLQKDFYFKQLKLELAQWMLVWLESKAQLRCSTDALLE